MSNKKPKLTPKKAGQPQKFKTVEELQTAIDEYFDYCDNRIQNVYSKARDEVIEIINPAPYTIMGLARALKMSRQCLLCYEKAKGYEKFYDTVKAGKLRVGEDVETRSIEGNAAGPIFNLKNNFGHKDKQEVELSGGLSERTDEELALRLKELEKGT